MPADGSQYLVTNTRSITSRGETSGSVHTQTVTYNNQTDRATNVLEENKVQKVLQDEYEQTTEYEDQTDRATTVLAANKVSVTEQVQAEVGSSEAVVKRPPTIQLQLQIEFTGGALC